MPRVNIPGVGAVNFPDTMKPEEITAAIEKDILPKTKAAPAPAAPEIENKAALFPRTARGADEGASYPKQVLNSGLDLLSMAGRGIAAGTEAATGGRGFKESFADTKGSTLLGGVVRDPGTTASIIAAPLAAPIVAGVRGAGALAAAGRAGIAGAVQGAGSAAAHQAEGVSDGQGASAAQGLGEVALSAALPAGLSGAATAAGNYLRRTAPALLRTAIKPVLGQMDTPNPPNFENALRSGVVPYFGGTDGASRNARGLVRQMGTAQQQLARDASRGGGAISRRVVANDVLGAAERRLNRMAQSPRRQLLAEEAQQAQEAVAHWGEEFANRATANGTGRITVQDALSLRQRIDETINWRRANTQLSPGFERASRLVRENLNRVIRREAPAVAEQTQELAGILPVTKALERRALQEGNNFKLGLLDVGALGVGGTIGGTSGGTEGAGAGTLAAMALLGGRRLISTPGGAAMLYDAGGRLAAPSAFKNLLNRGSSAAASQAFRKKDEK